MKDRTKALLVVLAICAVVVLPVVGESFLSSFYQTSSGVHYKADSGLAVQTSKAYEMQSGNPFTSESVNISTKNNGWVNISAASTSNLTVDEINGTWTNVSAINTGSATISINASDKQQVDVAGDTDQLSIRSMAIDDGTIDFWYEGPNGGTTTLTIHGLQANTDIVAKDANDGSLLGLGTTDASGTVTLDLDQSSHNVKLVSEGTTHKAKHTNPDPTGLVTSTPSELSIDINDSDFPTDEVQVNISLDGTLQKSTNITSNGTVTASIGTIDLGEHNWTVNTTDAYGNFNSTSYTFDTPSNVTLRNESNASQIITDKNVTVKFYSTNGKVVVQKGDTNGDGNISLEGLPNTAFVVTFDGQGWYDRRAYIDSIFNQQNFYLLNSSAFPTSDDSAIETTFVYEDRTGRFEQKNTTLQIQRAVDLDDDNNYTWTNIAGDYWGAAGEFPFTGEYQERYRLKITNQQTGKSRILGTHIPVSDGVKNIIVGQIVFNASDATGRYFNAGINYNTSNLQILYTDPTNGTTDLRIKVHEHGNKSNEIYNQTFTGPLGTKTVTLSLSSGQNETDWVVKYSGTHDSDGSISGQTLVGGARYPLNMDPAILAAFAYTTVTFIMLLYGPRTAIMGAWAGVIAFGGIMFLGWLDWNIVGFTIAVIAASAGTFYKEAMPN